MNPYRYVTTASPTHSDTQPLDLKGLAIGHVQAIDGWQLVYEGFNPRHEGIRETLCTLGNGYFATRGATVESFASGIHYPGTYIAGCYNRLVTTIDGHNLEHEDLVNIPNWLALTFRHRGERWLGIESVELLTYRAVLDLRAGTLSRTVRVRDEGGRITCLETRRLVHMAEYHVGAVEVTLTAENWSGPIEVRAALDGWITNTGVERYRLLANRHLEPAESRAVGDDAMLLAVRTSQSGILIAEAARTRTFVNDKLFVPGRATSAREGFVAQDLCFELEQDNPVTIEKVVAIYTSRDHAISEPRIAAIEKLDLLPGYDELLRTHALAWEHLWHWFEIDLDDNSGSAVGVEIDVILRLHIFHLLQSASRNSVDLDVGVGARGLHGEGYRGHVFWDELFIFPFLNVRMPDITRGLLMYRYRRLDTARNAALAAGYRGAMFPWQSGSDGREETPKIYYNLRSGRWIHDHTYLQRHVGAAIVYNVWQYYQVTGDRKFLEIAGAELILEIARFFASLATYNAKLERYEIRRVMGPDEYHSAYPGAPHPGLDNNTYTNVMAAWVLCRALDILKMLPDERIRELRESLAISDEELATWDAISRKLRVVFLENGVLAQFEGYDELEELDWAAYRARYGNIQRIDLILEAERDTPNRYKLSKQADVLMLFFLFSARELHAIFERLGYPLDIELLLRTIDYYLERTSDGSTLSRVAHAWVLARSDRSASWGVFGEALISDIADIQGGTTREGIHLGAMAGTVDLLVRCYTGLELRDDILWLAPQLPAPIQRLSLLVRYRAHTLRLVVTPTEVEVTAERSEVPSIRIAIRNVVHELRAGEHRHFPLT